MLTLTDERQLAVNDACCHQAAQLSRTAKTSGTQRKRLNQQQSPSIVDLDASTSCGIDA
jgi:hypothetical protein